MQRTLNDTEIQQAASVTIKNLTVTGFPDHIKLSFEIANHGQTRADEIATSWSWNVIDPVDEYATFHNPRGFFEGAPSEMGLSLDANDPARLISVNLDAFQKIGPGATIPRGDLVSGRKEAWFAVAGAYVDVFGKTHHFTDCVINRKNFGFSPCFGAHNKYD